MSASAASITARSPITWAGTSAPRSNARTPSIRPGSALGRGRFDLVLVNRVLDLDESSGLDLIRTLMGDGDLGDVPVMLVSNYPDAQDAAVELGASRGFGKADLQTPMTHDRLSALLG